jgi:Peptidase family M48
MTDQLARSLQATEWVPEEDAPERRSTAGLIGAVPPVLLGLCGLAAGPIPAAVAAGSGAVTMYVWTRAQGRLVLRSVGATHVEPGCEPRLRNLVEGLAADTGYAVPDLWLIPDGEPNALVCGARSGPAVAVTRSLLDRYTRTELEAVLAHCIVRLPSIAQLSQAVALGGLGDRIARVGFSQDAAAAALTRYPPALAGAIFKAEPTADRFGVFWFVGSDRSHESQTRRAERLLDL